MTGKQDQVSYTTAVSSFDHTPIAGHPAYGRLRQALSDLANEVGESGEEVSLADWLSAVRDMAVTSPYGDKCQACAKQCAAEHQSAEDGSCTERCYLSVWFPHALTRDGDWIRGTYACSTGHTWTCGYAVDIMRWV